ncbi:MAG TPA: TIGR03013 family PEP-CTERM/XrtA system glycosyltransferase [Candidatus Omnitrophota bacterium]|nr:TIGR03013 family PEP-CTERM/XrtA system glycosyltransferase [Candidatus Omnitrophota bacterium]HPS36508.1 TIGR03013 family PEP-CTERM/XrtA system glycosyltransferase [Candidatus Omnitrophota bacterium]
MRKPPDLYKKLVVLGGDIVLILIGISLAVAIRYKPVSVITYYTGATTFVVLSFVLCFYIFELYNVRRRFGGSEFLTHFAVAIVAGTALTGTVFYSVLCWKFGRGILLLNAVFIALLTCFWRMLFQAFFRLGRKQIRVLIAGAGASGGAIYNALKENEGYSIVGFVDDDPQNLKKEIGAHRVIGSSEMIELLVQHKEIDAVVVAITCEKKKKLISALLNAKLKGIDIFDMETVYENLTGKLPVDHLQETWLAYAELRGTGGSIYKLRIKHLISLVGTFFLLLISLPITLITALVIKLNSRGPVFFRQKRVGVNGKIFEIIKFRSMQQDAETDGAVWAQSNDSRVTFVGKWIRKLRIDEIPQLWNVFKGEMSLVGPRPERPEFVELLQKTMPFYFIRHVVKPGITGWAQVNYRYGASEEDALEKLQYDLYYVKNLSFILDMQIILKTIRVVLFGAGAR